MGRLWVGARTRRVCLRHTDMSMLLYAGHLPDIVSPPCADCVHLSALRRFMLSKRWIFGSGPRMTSPEIQEATLVLYPLQDVRRLAASNEFPDRCGVSRRHPAGDAVCLARP